MVSGQEALLFVLTGVIFFVGAGMTLPRLFYPWGWRVVAASAPTSPCILLLMRFWGSDIDELIWLLSHMMATLAALRGWSVVRSGGTTTDRRPMLAFCAISLVGNSWLCLAFSPTREAWYVGGDYMYDVLTTNSLILSCLVSVLVVSAVSGMLRDRQHRRFWMAWGAVLPSSLYMYLGLLIAEWRVRP